MHTENLARPDVPFTLGIVVLQGTKAMQDLGYQEYRSLLIASRKLIVLVVIAIILFTMSVPLQIFA